MNALAELFKSDDTFYVMLLIGYFSCCCIARIYWNKFNKTTTRKYSVAPLTLKRSAIYGISVLILPEALVAITDLRFGYYTDEVTLTMSIVIAVVLMVRLIRQTTMRIGIISFFFLVGAFPIAILKAIQSIFYRIFQSRPPSSRESREYRNHDAFTNKRKRDYWDSDEAMKRRNRDYDIALNKYNTDRDSYNRGDSSYNPDRPNW